MQIDWIDTFLDLTETRSFSRTAERLGLTQSTVSGRLVALETALGVRLFQRSRSGTIITTDGLKFEPHARLIRADWARARRSVGTVGTAAMTLRLCLQNDLSAAWLGDIIADFRVALPETAFYVEPDYSAQMCSDIVSGHADFAVVFTPKPHPDIAFTTVGEIPYRMISTTALSIAEVTLDSYIMANISPAFATTHRQMLPALSVAKLSVGQSIAVAGLLQAMGGAGYVMEGAARDMVATGHFFYVGGAPVIRQPVHTAVHLRDRISTLHRALVARVKTRFERKGSGARPF